ncbi:MAG: hypothetical protein H8E14_13575 [Candidatus Marinimicrobia bacterium]|nr:hypothetical protein [Candidatus Neomarinimicrobiota bacterium]
MEKDEIIFWIGKNWLQEEAKAKIGRELGEDELQVAKDCIEWGLTTGIDTVFNAAIQKAVQQSKY